MSKILVTGATGQLGGAVVKSLLEKVNSSEIFVLVRDLAKAEGFKNQGINVVQGDYSDPASLQSAFQGIDKLYFVSSSDVANRLSQHQNVVKAAIETKVSHIIYTSAQRKSEDGSSPIAFVADSHVQTDKLIKDSGITYTLLRHSLYSDILPMFMGDKVMDTQSIFLPAGEGKASYASRQDLAEAGAAILIAQGHENKTYELGGTASYSFSDLAAILSSLSGKEIQYISPSAQEYTEQLKGYGVPEQAIQGAATFCQAIAAGEFDFPSEELKTILGREPQTVEAFLKEAYKL